MDTTICPWCQTEIVWDEELGPEDVCPHCQNELKGYRTLNVQLDPDDQEEQGDELEWEADANEDGGLPYWERTESEPLPSLRTLDKYEQTHDLLNYEETVEKILDEQEEVPECPHCREYMMLAGIQEVTGSSFTPAVPGMLKSPVIDAPFKVNVYVCTGCFQVQYNLTEDDRLRFIERLSKRND